MNLYKRLEGPETKKIWRNYFTYALRALKISSPLLDGQKEALRVIWKDILDLKCNEQLFPELVLDFLGKVPTETRSEYAGEIKSYIEDLMQNSMENPYLPRLYVYLNKSEIETLDYLIHNANKFRAKNLRIF